MDETAEKSTSFGGVKETVKELAASGETYARLGLGQSLVLAFLASGYLGLSALLAIAVSAGIPWIGLQKAVSGAVFPMGLIAVIIGGALLFTGSAMVTPMGYVTQRIRWGDVFYNWVGAYSGNFIGGIVVAYITIVGASMLTGPGYGPIWVESITRIAVLKASGPSGAIITTAEGIKVFVAGLSWLEVFWRGVGANWLVNLAIYLAARTKDMTAKFFLIWFPTFTFFALGFEHSIVNMYLIPAGIMAGAPIQWSQFFYNNLIPATLGNIVGAGVFVGTFYWYVSGMPLHRRIGNVIPKEQYGTYRYLAVFLGKMILIIALFMGSLPIAGWILANASGYLGNASGYLTPIVIATYFIAVCVIVTRGLKLLKLRVSDES